MSIPTLSSHCTLRRLTTGLLRRCRAALHDESGMSTAEYGIGTLAAAAFGAVLYTVVTGDSILSGLTDIIDRALSTDVG